MLYSRGMRSKQVFLWYPRRIWVIEDGKQVQRFAWRVHATVYKTPRNRKKCNVGNAKHRERWPTLEDFIREQRPICKNPDHCYWQEILPSFIRRVIPSLIAHKFVGVQPMTSPSGEIFTLRYVYSGSETCKTQNQ